MVNGTTIQISKETRKNIEKLKLHPRQSSEEVVKPLISEAVEKQEGKKR